MIAAGAAVVLAVCTGIRLVTDKSQDETNLEKILLGRRSRTYTQEMAGKDLYQAFLAASSDAKASSASTEDTEALAESGEETGKASAADSDSTKPVKMTAGAADITARKSGTAGEDKSGTGESSPVKSELTADDHYSDCSITFDWWGEESRAQITQKAISQFEDQYPGVNVLYTYGKKTGWTAQKKKDIESGMSADMQQAQPSWNEEMDGAENYMDLREADALLDLSSYNPYILQAVQTEGGRQSALPWTMTVRTFMWNSALFEKAGLKTPESFEDLMAAGPVFHEKLGEGYYPLALTESDRLALIELYLEALTGREIYDQNGHLQVTEEEVQKAASWMRELEDQYVIPKSSDASAEEEAIDSVSSCTGFADGHYAGFYDWDTNLDLYKNALAGSALSFDDFSAGTPLTMNGSDTGTEDFKVTKTLVIRADTEHPKEAALFVQYLTQNPDAVRTIGMERDLPVLKTAAAVLYKDGTMSETEKAVYDGTTGAALFSWNDRLDSNSLTGSSGSAAVILRSLSEGRIKD
jgi:oligogalacturonide transport system substrate-binding protein